MIRVTAEYMKASVDAIAVPIWEACRDFEVGCAGAGDDTDDTGVRRVCCA